MLHKILASIFYILFFVTPLFWSSKTFELFEYNKMMLVYLLTILATLTWVLKMLNQKVWLFKGTPLDLPIWLFLGANILSTIFSIDQHVSVFGYYSRSNGGLLSIISYITLYYILVSNFDYNQVLKFLKVTIFGGVLVALYAIPEHFGVSPSCIILWGQANSSCWVQDVAARVFATLGQPNWLAGYLSALIFPALYFLLTAKSQIARITYFVSLITFYLAFTFTYSRGPTLGLIAGMLTFLISIFFSHQKNIKLVALLLVTFLVINLLFGSALSSFTLLNKFAATARESVTTALTSTGTQLETGGTESGKIRLVVWKGAIDIFKNYPIFGSGLETFAYSYYQFRPVEHNLLSEWDYLYNKAHNEYLNYLATTGVVGFLSYLFLIASFIYLSIKYLLSKNSQNTNYQLLTASLLASYISILIYNFFLFSVVVTNLFFYLFPALVFISNGAIRQNLIPQKYLLSFKVSFQKPILNNLIKIFFIFIALYFLNNLFNFYKADKLYSKGLSVGDGGNPGESYNLLTDASNLNPGEPIYISEKALAAASAASVLNETDATTSAKLKNEAETEIEALLKTYPKNISFHRTAVRSYFSLSQFDPEFTQKTLDILDKSIALAPTDPKLVYNKALILKQIEKSELAETEFIKAIDLKPNYKEAYLSLIEIYKSSDQKDQLEKLLKSSETYFKNDPDFKK